MHAILTPKSKIVRARNAWRHPAQATIAARIPLVGRRVPMRGFWRRRSVAAAPRAERYVTKLAAAASAAGARVRGPGTLEKVSVRGRQIGTRTGAAAVRAMEQTANVASSAPPASDIAAAVKVRGQRALEAVSARTPRPSSESVGAWRLLAAGVALGALAMYLLDPGRGRRRRALARDRVVHLGHIAGRQMPRRLERRGRFIRGMFRGAQHGAARRVGIGDHALDDDETLVQRVRSEIFRDTSIKAGEVNIDAYEGTVTLRGQMPSPGEIRRLIDAAKHVEGVRRVRSYLHMRDEPPPNKAEVYEEATEHLPAM